MTPEQWRARKAATERHYAKALRALARKPDAIVDIGVRQGTPWLYDAFPNVPFLLVDPQEGGESLLTARPASFVFVNKAAGRAPGRLMLNEQGAMSTFLKRTALTAVPTRKTCEAEIVTLDDLIDAHLANAHRIGLKIDTEGFELEVLAGLESRLDRIDFIVSEASVLNRFEGSYNFSELVVALWHKGLRFYNFLGEPGLLAPRVHDCIFLRAGDPAFDRK